MIELSFKLTLENYRKINFLVLYKQPVTIILTLIGILSLIFFVLNLVGSAGNILSDTLPHLGIGIAFTFAIPAMVFISSKKTFETNNYLQEEIFWTISEEKIKFKGKSFGAEYSWSNIFKIKKVSNWVIIYQSKAIANFIPIESFRSNEDVNLFWEYAKMNNVKVD